MRRSRSGGEEKRLLGGQQLLGGRWINTVARLCLFCVSLTNLESEKDVFVRVSVPPLFTSGSHIRRPILASPSQPLVPAPSLS